MDVWFDIDQKDVIEILQNINNGQPWSSDPTEKHSVLIFWEDGVIRLAVDEFFEDENGNYSCCRFYTNIVAKTMEEYKTITQEQLSHKAYSAWCSGARCC